MSSLPELSKLARSPREARGLGRTPGWLLPLILSMGLLAVGLYLFRDRLLPGKEVEIGRVLALEGRTAAGPGQAGASPAAASAGEVVFQASGWVEPAPSAVQINSQVNGQVATVLVKDGEDVTAGQILATLEEIDFRYPLEVARAKFCQAQAEEDAAREQSAAARNLVHARKAAVASTLTSLEETKDLSARLDGLPEGAVPAVEKVGARLAVARAEAAVAEQRALLTEAEAEAARRHTMIWVAETVRRAAAFQLAEAELAMSRTKIHAPVAGRIQRLQASPGQRKRVDGDEPESAAIATIYQPGALQVRVDVPLADAGGIVNGQPVKIRPNLRPGMVIEGKVDGIAGEADRQRNTLAALVSLGEQGKHLRPGVLCRVEFLGVERAGGTPVSGVGNGLVLHVPTAALANGPGNRVWVVDPETRRVSVREVVPGPAESEGYREVREGLQPGEWVVLNPEAGLKEGDRVNPRELP